MKLVIAEKPSVAKAYATVLGVTKRKDGYYEGPDYLISWCIGHLAGIADAEVYNEAYKHWDLSQLPIIPEPWRLVVSPAKQKQFIRLLRKIISAIKFTSTLVLIISMEWKTSAKTQRFVEHLSQTMPMWKKLLRSTRSIEKLARNLTLCTMLQCKTIVHF